MTSAARAFLVAFVVDAAIHLFAVTANLDVLGFVTKPLLMILLIGVTLSSVKFADHPAVKFLVLGQIFSCVGDIALMPDGQMFFILGMAGFGVAQVMYILGYFRIGARQGYAERKWVLIVYPAFWVIANAALFPGLGILRIPIAIYSLFLVGMAMTSMSLGTVFGIGGTLFMLSDLTIGENVAYGVFPGAHTVIMATYIVGQLIICLCFINRVKASSLGTSDAFASVSAGQVAAES
jgi:uncharacterized membrane protein YhhN